MAISRSELRSFALSYTKCTYRDVRRLESSLNANCSIGPGGESARAAGASPDNCSQSSARGGVSRHRQKRSVRHQGGGVGPVGVAVLILLTWKRVPDYLRQPSTFPFPPVATQPTTLKRNPDGTLQWMLQCRPPTTTACPNHRRQASSSSNNSSRIQRKVRRPTQLGT